MLRYWLPFFLCAGIASNATADHLPLDAKLVMTGPMFSLSGSEISYTITLTGLFPHATYAVVDTLPTNARLVSAGEAPWTCLQQGGNVTCGTSQLSDSSATLTIVIDAPLVTGTLVNSATITSFSTFDPFPDNNTDTLQTTLYDVATCGARQIKPISPPDGSAFESGHVTLQWSVVPGAVHYDLWAAVGSPAATLLGTTSETQLTYDFPDGDVLWYVEASTNDCPPAGTTLQRLRIGKPAPKRRAVAH